MNKTVPAVYEDTPMRWLPGDEHNPPLLIQDTESVIFEVMGDRSRLVKVTMPPGRSWVMLPADLFSDRILK